MVLLPMPLFWWYAILAPLFCMCCRLKMGLQYSILLLKYFHIFCQEKRSATILQNHPDGLWNPPNLLFNQYWGSFLGVKWMKCHNDLSLLSTANVKNEWSYTPPPLVCLHAVDRDNFMHWMTWLSHEGFSHFMWEGRTLLKSVKKIQVF